MKISNTLILLSILSFSLLWACEGPAGIPGQDGANGENGEEGYAFEYTLTFSAPDYGAVLELPSDFTMLDSDVMMVYLLWEITDDGTEIWRALPQSLYFTDGILSYNFDFTKYDARVFLDGTVDLDGLGADLTDNWIARIVVLPAQFVNARTKLDYTDYNQVKAYLNLPDTDHTTGSYPTRPAVSE
ncbi:MULTISPECIES: hypothetical protein [Reichenbachiella]|uniref:Collagen triple helix repeat-containing protein n=1 Tax=Reichenbachiella agariperforans TaxID=156994 RepID=A0A1M6J2M3_REIAG|nr:MULTISPECIES: hypothetical protein [Reichenbachiella]RJE74962.1 hypothetical protein BGP76_17745 [Reichenbachiella sp. MSK19-1]SHJ40919.1 hypothetical protein SAMN04488028_10116 [Reichenbachiella agariperforans]